MYAGTYYPALSLYRGATVRTREGENTLTMSREITHIFVRFSSHITAPNTVHSTATGYGKLWSQFQASSKKRHLLSSEHYIEFPMMSL